MLVKRIVSNYPDDIQCDICHSEHPIEHSYLNAEKTPDEVICGVCLNLYSDVEIDGTVNWDIFVGVHK